MRREREREREREEQKKEGEGEEMIKWHIGACVLSDSPRLLLHLCHEWFLFDCGRLHTAGLGVLAARERKRDVGKNLGLADPPMGNRNRARREGGREEEKVPLNFKNERLGLLAYSLLRKRAKELAVLQNLAV